MKAGPIAMSAILAVTLVLCGCGGSGDRTNVSSSSESTAGEEAQTEQPAKPSNKAVPDLTVDFAPGFGTFSCKLPAGSTEQGVTTDLASISDTYHLTYYDNDFDRLQIQINMYEPQDWDGSFDKYINAGMATRGLAKSLSISDTQDWSGTDYQGEVITWTSTSSDDATIKYAGKSLLVHQGDYMYTLCVNSTDDLTDETNSAFGSILQTVSLGDASSSAAPVKSKYGSNVIGKDLPAGLYKVESTGGDAYAAIYATADTDATGDIVTNDNFTKWIWLRVTDGQKLELDGAVATLESSLTADPQTTLESSGTYRVGFDCPEGAYTIKSNGSDAYWAVLSGPDSSSIVNNETFTPSDGDQHVTVGAGQYLTVDGCTAKHD